MSAPLMISYAALWLAVLAVGFLLLGALRAQALLRWRLDQLEATAPRRVGRSGLRPGRTAPDFTLPGVAGPDVALHDFAGRRVFLVFTQSGCGPCHAILPELNRLQGRGEVEVLVVNAGDPAEARRWAAEARARFPVLVQEQFSVSKRYEAFATPFAFLIDERGVIRSKGIINNREHIDFVLSRAREAGREGPEREEAARAEAVEA
jgi:methylamine dehydrogenase accessory protein MauD